MRQFLVFAGTNSIEDIQSFTAQKAPIPTWVKASNVDVPQAYLDQAATHLQEELGPEGLHAVGGRSWWQWRQDDNPLRAEWIEMDKDYKLRERRKSKCERSMLYLPGGAYYFGGVDAHRYQIQRHARKLQARVLAPRYRLAPQFPFPCGLLDCLAAYLFLLSQQPPETIVLAGDSAGGGMALSLMVILRDQGLPMPAGATLLSPWVDLSHSFPSVAEDNKLDYVPTDGFHHKPSMSWPPPNSDELTSLDDVMIEMDHGKQISAKALRDQAKDRAEKGKEKQQVGDDTVVDGRPAGKEKPATAAHTGDNLFCDVDGKSVEIKDQIQFYAPNELLAHPLVSPIMQASLGGLPPLCILTGGGELLRDEQIYLAHKAADPSAYPPPAIEDYSPSSLPHSNLQSGAAINSAITRYPPTYVQLQVWDDLCHVATTLSWTRPAKHMYRSVAQFGAWALARAQMSEIRILDDDEVSVISNQSSDSDSDDPASEKGSNDSGKLEETSNKEPKSPFRSHRPAESGLYRPTTPATVGRAGDPLPLFREHMIRQRVTRHGDIYALDAPSTLVATTMPVIEIGKIKQGTVKKWLAVQDMLRSRFGEVKREVQDKRLQEMVETTGGRGMVFTAGREHGILIGEERPPATALAGRTTAQLESMGLLKRQKDKMSKGLSMWSGWGSKHDQDAIEKEDAKVKLREDVTMSVVNVRRRQSMNLLGTGPIPGGGPLDAGSHSQASPSNAMGNSEAVLSHDTIPVAEAQMAQSAAPPQATHQFDTIPAPTASTVSPSQSTAPLDDGVVIERTISSQQRAVVAEPSAGSQPATVPFKLARPPDISPAQASTLTLDSADGVTLPDSATLPPSSYPHHSIASTLKPADVQALGVGGERSKHMSEPLPAAGVVGFNDSRTGSTTDISRPSTADATTSRPLSPTLNSTHESLVEAQPAQAQAVRISHARASKGSIDAAAMAKLANIDNEMPPVPNGGASLDINGSRNLDRDLTPKGERIPDSAVGGTSPTVGGLHGAEKRTGDEIHSAQIDSSNWASDALQGVEDAGSKTSLALTDDGEARQRPGIERFVTADQL